MAKVVFRLRKPEPMIDTDDPYLTGQLLIAMPALRDPRFAQVCRVGNLYPGAESANDAAASPALVLPGARFGEYWHHDGNFFAAPRNAVLNTLHARVVPAEGGATYFLDTTAAPRAGAAPGG